MDGLLVTEGRGRRPPKLDTALRVVLLGVLALSEGGGETTGETSFSGGLRVASLLRVSIEGKRLSKERSPSGTDEGSGDFCDTVGESCFELTGIAPDGTRLTGGWVDDREEMDGVRVIPDPKESPKPVGRLMKLEPYRL